jgi:hypothetical protein
MVGVPQGTIAVFGANFASGVQVLIDGQPAPSFFESAGEVDAEISTDLDSVAGVHQITVEQGSQTSNRATWTVYTPAVGPQPFNAIPGYFPQGASSGPLAVADVNGDGFADVILAGPVTNNVPSLAIMFGRADGSFGPPVVTPGLSVGAMAVGDVNGDGSPDIVTSAPNSSQAPTISVLLNDGHGNFTQGSVISTAALAGFVQLADLNGDGKPDIVVSGNNPSALSYLPNLGGGSFGAVTPLAVPAADNPSFAIADMNDDGKPDIVYVATNGPLDQLHIILNQGNGSFSDEVAPGINVEAGYFAVGDFNLDGHMDIALQPDVPFESSSSVSINVYFGQGNGSFVAGPTSLIETVPFQTFQLVAGDFDHDGFLDIAGVNGDTEPGHVVFLWGDGAGHFTAQDVNGPMGFSLMTADVNGDGVPDLIIPDRFGIISVVLGRHDRDFPSATSFRPPVLGIISVADVNGDGKPDLLVPDESANTSSSIYVNQGANQFELTSGAPAQSLQMADLDGDGLADLVGTDGTNILIWKGTGSSTFGGSPVSIAPPAGVGFQAQQIQIVDMDGDGRPDIVMPGVILFNQGNLSFSAVAVNFGSTQGPFVVGDFNHDGHMDIASGGFTLLGQGNRSFRTVTPNNLNLTGGNFAAVGDLNGDGNADVVYSGDEVPMEVFYSRGDGTFYQQSVLNFGPVSDFSQAITVADFNGDGIPDVMACLFLSQQCVLFTNDGKGGFALSYFASGATSVAASSPDLNGDSKPDLILTNYLLDFRPPNFLVLFHK